MGMGIRYLAVLLCVCSALVLGTLIFTQGFLLKRVVVNQTSNCDVDFTIQSERHGEEGCWMHKRFSKAVIIIIDALRYDFMLYNSSASPENVRNFENKLPILYELLNQRPLNSRLYKFLADPPTTTLQRLKGLTTGSLPTFIDAGSNFASYEILEDNIIDQLKTLNRHFTFLGDDTWLGLFPDRFFRSFPFPSFNVMDLDTVDNGIKKHLVPEIKRNDWEIIIAHFLGVDHCGHRFGPIHPEMARKLREMDTVIRSVVKQLKEDTILFVMGDHGMTGTGDHGGDSRNELEAGLFVYSPAQITATELPKDPKSYKTLSQVDLVPTLSLLLGAPIPFSNLGMVITDLFNHCPWWKTENSKIKQVYHSLKSLRLNAYQVNGYLEAYKAVSGELQDKQLKRLQDLFLHTEVDLQNLLTAMVKNNDNRDIERRMKFLEDHYITYITEVKALCQEKWAKFDMTCIYYGLAVVFLTVICSLVLIFVDNSQPGKISWTSYICVGACLLPAFCGIVLKSYTGDMFQMSMPYFLGGLDVLVCGLLTVGVWSISKRKPAGKPSGTVENVAQNSSLCVEVVTSGIMICMLFFVYFSNSYVVYHDRVVTFCAQTLITVLGYIVVKSIFKKDHDVQISEMEKSGRQKRAGHFDFMKLLTHPAWLAAAVVFGLLTSVRMSTVFRACREEQEGCLTSPFAESLSESMWRNVRYIFSVMCLIGSVLIHRSWLKHFGNLNGHSFPVLCARYALPAAGLCIAFHWALQGLPPKVLDTLPTWQCVLLPRTAYSLLAISFIAGAVHPLCLYTLPADRNQEIVYQPGLSKTQLIPTLFNSVKLNWSRNDTSEKLPIVYGLGTVYSSSVVYLASTLSLLLSLLLSDSFSPVVFLMLLVQFLYFEMCAVFYSRAADIGSSGLFLVIGWSVLASVFFYNSGHQASITTIQWKAAFVGFPGDHDTVVLPAILTGLNTFASHVLFTVASPLLLFSTKISCRITTVFSRKKTESADFTEKGDFYFHEDPVGLRAGLFRLCLSLIFVQSLTLLGSMCAAGLHRRHLMVWKIFAPRFVFEAVTSFIVFAVCILMYAFILRLDFALSKWVKNLNDVSHTKQT